MTEMAAIECEREPPISENYDYPKTTSSRWSLVGAPIPDATPRAQDHIAI